MVEFETADPTLRGEMTITISLADAGGGTEVVAVHDGLPSGLSAADNEAGWRSSLAQLAALVEADQGISGEGGRIRRQAFSQETILLRVHLELSPRRRKEGLRARGQIFGAWYLLWDLDARRREAR